jgi:hypothetical protein
MAKVMGKIPTEVEIDIKAAVIALSKELGVYEYLKSNGGYEYCDIINDKIVYHEDISFHGSPVYSDKVVCGEKKKVESFRLIKELIKINELQIIF